MSTVLLSGASGFIGSRLRRALERRGDRVVPLTRRVVAGAPSVRWDAEAGQIDTAALAAAAPAIVINLAGEYIAQRWTADTRRRIHDSRVNGTDALARALAALPTRPTVLLNASASNYYGAQRSDEDLTETSAPGTGFLANVVLGWEAATHAASEAGIRVVLVRTAPVLGRDGGPLARMLPFFRLGLGGPVGSGRQWFSWIALEDAVRAMLFLVDRAAAAGAYNLAAPAPERWATFARTLGRVLHRPAVLSAPPFAMRLVFGEMVDETLLADQRLLPARLLAEGFEFRYPRLEDALRAALSRSADSADR